MLGSRSRTGTVTIRSPNETDSGLKQVRIKVLDILKKSQENQDDSYTDAAKIYFAVIANTLNVDIGVRHCHLFVFN